MKFKYGIGILALLVGSFSAYLIMKLDSSEKSKQVISTYKNKKYRSPVIKNLFVKEEIEKIEKEKPNKEELSISRKMWNIGKALQQKRISGKTSDISNEDLFKIMSVEEKSSFINANLIVLDRGLYKEAFEFGKKLETKMIKEFLYTYSYPKVLDDPQNRELRQGLLKSYLNSNKRMQLVYAVDSLNQLDFNSFEVEELKKTFCAQKIPKKNEAQIALHYKFENFLRKYHVKEC